MHVCCVLVRVPARSKATFVEVQEGMEIDHGYISPQYVTNNERLLVEYDNCRVLVTDQKIEAIFGIVPILAGVRAWGRKNVWRWPSSRSVVMVHPSTPSVGIVV
jgi:hypothetical protein